MIGIDSTSRGVCETELAHDLGDPSQTSVSRVASFLKETMRDQPISGVINCAATQITGNFADLAVEDIQTSFNVNTLAPLWLSQLCLPQMQPDGCIVNIGSIHARLTKAGFLPYSVSKSALSGLTRAMALELGHRIRVIEIQPAAIATPLLEAGFSDNPEARSELDEYHPTKRIGTPAEVAELCLIIFQHPITFLNGSVIPIDGGIGGALSDPA